MSFLLGPLSNIFQLPQPQNSQPANNQSQTAQTQSQNVSTPPPARESQPVSGTTSVQNDGDASAPRPADPQPATSMTDRSNRPSQAAAQSVVAAQVLSESVSSATATMALTGAAGSSSGITNSDVQTGDVAPSASAQIPILPDNDDNSGTADARRAAEVAREAYIAQTVIDSVQNIPESSTTGLFRTPEVEKPAQSDPGTSLADLGKADVAVAEDPFATVA